MKAKKEKSRKKTKKKRVTSKKGWGLSYGY